MTTSEISRRAALAAGASAVGAVGLAACGTSSGGSSTAQGGGGSKSGTQVAKVSDIGVGKAISANADGKPVIVSRPTANTVACFSAICTHQGCTVAAQGSRAVCPCHGSIYNALTGAVIQPPAPAALAKVAVTVKNGEIVTG